MNRVGGGISVGNDQSALTVIISPYFLEGGISVHRKEYGGCICVHIRRVYTEFPVQVHPDQGRTGLSVLGKNQLLKIPFFLFQTGSEQTELGGLAGAIRTLNND